MAAWAGEAAAVAHDRVGRDADPGRVQPDARLEHPDEGQALHVVEPALHLLGVVGQGLGILAVAAFTWFMLSRHSWRWGLEIWGWAGAYPGYILLVTSTTPSRVRYALLAFPMTLIIAWFLLRWWSRWRYWILAAIVVIGAFQMWWWLEHYLIIKNLADDLYP